MSHALLFADVVDAAEQLSADEQEELITILRRKLAEDGRRRILADIEESRQEYEAGKCKEATVEEIMREIRS